MIRNIAASRRPNPGFRILLVPFLISVTLCSALSAQEKSQPYLTFRKTNLVLLDVGAEGQFDSTQAKYPSILKVGDQWWMWYSGRTDDHFIGSIGLATSKDGMRWTKHRGGDPVFEHGLPDTFDATKTDHPTVLRFDDKFHMWYTAGDPQSHYTTGYATSIDGVRWSRENHGRPVLGPGGSGQFDDQVVLHPAVVRDDSGLLHMWYNGVGPQKSFRVGHATSRDGIVWTRQNNGNPVLVPSVVGSFHEEYVYNVFVRLEDDCFHMWYSAWSADGQEAGASTHNCITHAVSSDGDDWKKDSTPTIVNGPVGSIDEYASFACQVVDRGDEQWMYYSAGAASADGSAAGGETYRVSLAVATTAGDSPQGSSPSRFFRHQYHKPDLSFCNSQVAADFDGDGQRELLFASRKTNEVQMLRARDGSVIWSKKLIGDQQSLSAYDLDGDGKLEILYSVSSPGLLYVLDHRGEVLRQWDSGDHKLGNSAVIVDVNHDGQLDGLFGSRSTSLIRLNMENLTLDKRRSNWQQCGGHTAAMDVDRDGHWDFFSGSGDDSANHKGVLHRYDPISLESLWSYKTDDNASSADAVLVDLDGDGQVEILKSVDNYSQDDAHDALYAFETDGTLLWKVPGISEEDSPNAADLDGDGKLEIVGMTFGCEIYCLDSHGRYKWRMDLRPELDEGEAHAYLTPILCDLDGDKEMEILAITNGGYFSESGEPIEGQTAAHGVVFAISADGEVLDRFDVGGNRYFGDAFVCNLDEDPYLELIVSGSGGLDVIETKGYGPNQDHMQRRRNYQRLNVVPWAYQDTYFIYRGKKEGVANSTDNLVLAKQNSNYRSAGKFTTELLTLPPGGFFDRLIHDVRTPEGTSLRANLINQAGKTLYLDLPSEAELNVDEPVRLEFVFSSTNPDATPTLDSYSLGFARREE